MTRRNKLYEGKAKIIYEGPEPGTVIQYFKDDATAFNAVRFSALTRSMSGCGGFFVNRKGRIVS